MGRVKTALGALLVVVVEQQVVELHAQAAADTVEMCTVLWAVAEAVPRWNRGLWSGQMQGWTYELENGCTGFPGIQKRALGEGG